MTSTPISNDELQRLERERFVELFGGVFEHSPWVAERAFVAGRFQSVEALHGAMVEVMRRASRARQLALIRAHPDLAGRAAIRGELTAASSVEQAGAGLDHCSREEFERFHELNDRYRKRFGFPFILAVKGKSRREILAAFEERLGNSVEAEFEEALTQIARIARFRLDDLIRS
jgi:2-oxo-4-hydroxy-4-carboxy-5-ureidoimidazoline decarboxylase